MAQKQVSKSYGWARYGWILAAVVYGMLIQLQGATGAAQQQEPPASRATRVKIRPADQPATQAQEQQPAAPEEAIAPSGANLKTAMTIYIERLPHNLHLYITAELNKQQVPYRILLDKREADLWMVGTAEVFQKDRPPSKLREAGETLSRVIMVIQRERFPPPSEPDAKTLASVFIVPRGGQEVLWAARSEVYSNLGASQGSIARRLVKDLRNALKKAK